MRDDVLSKHCADTALQSLQRNSKGLLDKRHLIRICSCLYSLAQDISNRTAIELANREPHRLALLYGRLPSRRQLSLVKIAETIELVSARDSQLPHCIRHNYLQLGSMATHLTCQIKCKLHTYFAFVVAAQRRIHCLNLSLSLSLSVCPSVRRLFQLSLFAARVEPIKMPLKLASLWLSR